MQEKQIQIHQMWLDKTELANANPPPKFASLCATWKTTTEFDYQFWNRARVEQLFQDFPFLKEFQYFYQNQLSEHIERCDFARYMIMATHSGIYLDLRYECCQPKKLVEFLRCKNKDKKGIQQAWFLDLMDLNTSCLIQALLCENRYTFTNAILLDLRENHGRAEFWMSWMRFIVLKYHESHFVMDNTGPSILTDFLRQTDKGKECLSRSEILYAKPNLTESDQGGLVGIEYRVGMGSGWCSNQAEKCLRWSYRRHTETPFIIGIFFILFFLMIQFLFASYNRWSCNNTTRCKRQNLVSSSAF
jgi:mannosyltransferase OCH1-like enzyme